MYMPPSHLLPVNAHINSRGPPYGRYWNAPTMPPPNPLFLGAQVGILHPHGSWMPWHMPQMLPVPASAIPPDRIRKDATVPVHTVALGGRSEVDVVTTITRPFKGHVIPSDEEGGDRETRKAGMARAFGNVSSEELDGFIQMRVPATDAGVQQLKIAGSSLGLTVCRGHRHTKLDRVGFGLAHSVRRYLAANAVEVPMVLFIWHRREVRKGNAGPGRLLPGQRNVEMARTWLGAAKQYAKLTKSTPAGSGSADAYKQKTPQIWTEAAVELLLEDRLKPSPETYSTIAGALNRMRYLNSELYGDGRRFTPRDVNNKWHRLFPSADDTNDAIKYLRDLQVDWPGAEVNVHCTGSGTCLHAPSDATFTLRRHMPLRNPHAPSDATCPLRR